MVKDGRVLVAGATGTLGIPLVRALLARGYEVIGMTRSPEKAARLETLGARALVADALDSPAVEQAFQATAPDFVIDLLTAIPKNGPTSAAHMRATNDLRVRGTANLLKASIGAGVRRIVGESMVFAYGFGDHGATARQESDPLQAREPRPWLQEIVNAIRLMEEQLLYANQQGWVEAIPLRYGLFYGPHSGSTQYLLRMLKQRRMPTIAGAEGLAAWIHTDDAVQATLAALECGKAGEIYNIVDDEPVNFNQFVGEAAQQMGLKPPMRVPLWLIKILMPYLAVFTSTRLPVSNQKAKAELGWSLQYPNYRDGLRQTIAAYETLLD